MRIIVPGFILVFTATSSVLAQPAASTCPRPAAPAATPNPAVSAARKAEHQACAADMARFCANVPTGCGRPMQCLRAHAAELSAACTDGLAQLRAVRMQAR